jgi:hypothetical protein
MASVRPPQKKAAAAVPASTTQTPAAQPAVAPAK